MACSQRETRRFAWNLYRRSSLIWLRQYTFLVRILTLNLVLYIIQKSKSRVIYKSCYIDISILSQKGERL
jgi:hypothetical protein